MPSAVCCLLSAVWPFPAFTDPASNRAVLRGETNPDIPRTLAAARAAAKEANWPETARRYIEVLETWPDAVIARGGGLYDGAADLALRELAALPPEGRAAARAHVAPRADGLLRDAAEARDETALAALIDRHPFSDAAGRAFGFLSRRVLESGRTAEAADLADRLPGLAALLPPESLPPEGLAALAAALSRAGDQPRLGALLDLVTRAPALRDAPLTAGAGELTLGAFVAPLHAALPAHAAGDGGPVLRSPQGEGGWPHRGGDASQARLMDPLPEIPRPLRTIELPLPFAGIGPFAAEMQLQRFDMPSPPPYHPSVVDGMCFLATDRGVIALNLLAAAPDDGPGAAGPAPAEGAPPADADDALLAWRYDAPAVPAYTPDDRATWGVSVHRGVVYATPVRGVTEAEHQLYFFVKYPFPRRSLVALDAWTGRKLWEVGGEAGASDVLASASFVQPPTPDGDVLYAGVTVQKNPTDPIAHHVVCLDAATGRLRWRTYVSQGSHEVNLFNNHIRDGIGTAVAQSGDALYYGTHLGCVAALDRATGRLRWVRKYEQIAIPPPRSVNVHRQPLRWVNNPPVAAGGVVCVTPLDGLHLLALDAATGEDRWRLEWPGDNAELWRHAAGVKDGMLFVSGRVLMAVDLAGGRRRWVYAPAGETGIGRGGATPDAVLFPTDRGLHRVDPATGRALSFRPWSRPMEEAGNVVSAGGALVSVSGPVEQPGRPGASLYVTVYAEAETLRAFGEEALARDPENLLLRFRAASGALAAGRGAEADRLLAECLERAEARPGEPDAARVRTLARGRLFRRRGAEALRAARESPAEARRILAEARGYADDGAAARELALRAGDALVAARHWADALDVLQEAVLGAGEAEGETRMAAAQAIDRILAAAGRELYAPHEAAARDRLEAARRDPSLDGFAAVARSWPNSLAAREAGLAALDLHEAAGGWEALAAAARAFLRDVPDGPAAAQAARALVVALENRGLHGEAKRVLKQMASRWRGATVRDGGQEVRAETFAEARLALPVYQRAAAAGAPPELRLPLAPAWTYTAGRAARAGGGRAFLQSRLLTPRPAADGPAAGLVLLAVDGAVHALDLDTGRVRWEQAVGALPTAAAAVDETLVLVAGARLVGLRARTGEVAWRYESAAAFQRVTAGGGLIIAAAPELRTPHHMRLIALDPAAGRIAWSSLVPGFPISDFFAAEDHLAIVLTPPARLLALDATTGKTLHATPLDPLFPHQAAFLPPDRAAFVGPDGRVLCLSTATGERRWEATLGDVRPILPPGVGGGALAVCGANVRRQEVVVFEAAGGRRIVAGADLPPPPLAGPTHVATDGDAAFLLLTRRDTGSQILRAFEKTRTRWTFEPAGPGVAFVAPLLAREHVVLPLGMQNPATGGWTPRVVVVDKAKGEMAQDLVLGADAQGGALPQIEPLPDGLAILTDTTVRVYRGK